MEIKNKFIAYVVDKSNNRYKVKFPFLDVPIDMDNSFYNVLAKNPDIKLMEKTD